MVPPGPTRPRDRREQILDAAAEAFGRRGFDGVTVAELAAAVGVTAPALYRHFGAKDEILSAVTTEVLDRLVDIVETRHEIGDTTDGPENRSQDVNSHSNGGSDGGAPRDGRSVVDPSSALGDENDPENGVTPLTRMTLALTTEVLDRPWHVVAYLRERHRWVSDTSRPTRREVELFSVIDSAIEREIAGARAHDRRCRIVAMVGVLRGVAERAPRLRRPAADTFIAMSVTSMLRCPPISAAAPGSNQESGPAAWRVPASPRERILAASLPLFRARGFDGVGIGEIGEHAGVGAGNVTRYYTHKEEVLVDMYDRVGARVEVAIDDAVRTASDAGDALDRLLDAYTAIAFDAADLVVVVGDNRGALPRDQIARLRRRDRRVGDIWRAVISEVRPELRPPEAAAAVAGVIALINSFPRHEPDDLPDPSEVAPLARAFVASRPARPDDRMTG